MTCITFSHHKYGFECFLCGYAKVCRTENEYSTATRLHFKIVHKRKPPKKSQLDNVVTEETHVYKF